METGEPPPPPPPISNHSTALRIMLIDTFGLMIVESASSAGCWNRVMVEVSSRRAVTHD